jgi:ribosome biogenesis SPOUT family RNA methylase Rps3
MTTDTALGVTKLVVKDGILLSKIPYVVRSTIFRFFELTG